MRLKLDAARGGPGQPGARLQQLVAGGGAGVEGEGVTRDIRGLGAVGACWAGGGAEGNSRGGMVQLAAEGFRVDEL